MQSSSQDAPAGPTGGPLLLAPGHVTGERIPEHHGGGSTFPSVAWLNEDRQAGGRWVVEPNERLIARHPFGVGVRALPFLMGLPLDSTNDEVDETGPGEVEAVDLRLELGALAIEPSEQRAGEHTVQALLDRQLTSCRTEEQALLGEIGTASAELLQVDDESAGGDNAAHLGCNATAGVDEVELLNRCLDRLSTDSGSKLDRVAELGKIREVAVGV